MTTILAFDIGIKNLAFCVLRKEATGLPVVLDLQNINLFASEVVDAPLCSTPCAHKATYQCSVGLTCKRHVPKTHTLNDLDKPSVKGLKDLAKSVGLSVKGKREEILATVLTRFALPFKAPKSPKAAHQSLERLHDALHQFVTEFWATFRQCHAILLENQPVYKNPHMKSVQVLLFATLRERFMAEGLTVPPCHLVHAKTKVEGAAAGDAGYKDRKAGSEERLRLAFDSAKVTGCVPALYESWCSSKKRSDMADAFCMCMDFQVKCD